jgi:cbb3-type cytochrome oxidase subunit 3
MTADLVTLVCELGTIVLGLGALAVTWRALGHADRHRYDSARANDRAVRAEARASRYYTLLGSSIFDGPAKVPDPDGAETRLMARINERHETPVSHGGPLRSAPVATVLGERPRRPGAVSDGT